MQRLTRVFVPNIALHAVLHTRPCSRNGHDAHSGLSTPNSIMAANKLLVPVLLLCYFLGWLLAMAGIAAMQDQYVQSDRKTNKKQHHPSTGPSATPCRCSGLSSFCNCW